MNWERTRKHNSHPISRIWCFLRSLYGLRFPFPVQLRVVIVSKLTSKVLCFLPCSRFASFPRIFEIAHKIMTIRTKEIEHTTNGHVSHFSQDLQVPGTKPDGISDPVSNKLCMVETAKWKDSLEECYPAILVMMCLRSLVQVTHELDKDGVSKFGLLFWRPVFPSRMYWDLRDNIF